MTIVKLILLLFILFISFILYFFRKPDIVLYPNENDIIRSPAFGKILLISNLPNDTLFIAIFLSPFDIHYSLNPCNGVVENVEYDHTGRFELAFDLQKSRLSEKAITTYIIPQGKLKVYQIAGYLARRIVTYVTPGQKVVKGSYHGLIKLGSRVDIIIPKASQFKLLAQEKDYLRGSDSVIGHYL